MNKKVVVLLSSYNGEKYIEEQLESILTQTYKNIEILVRDDGSSDNTVNILKVYEQRGKIKLVCGENLGFTKSFFWLLDNAPDADYYSFADQDDVWFEDKIENAVNVLNDFEPNSVTLYFSDFDFYDGDMNFVSHKKPLKKKITLASALTNPTNYGYTCVITKKLKELFITMDPERLFPHDYLSLLIAISLGKVYYDKRACAKYRRHEKNVSVSGSNFLKLQIWRIKNFLLRDDFGFNQKFIDFYNVFGGQFNKKDKSFMKLFTNKKYRFDYAIRKAFYPVRYRELIFDEIMLRFSFIIGKL